MEEEVDWSGLDGAELDEWRRGGFKAGTGDEDVLSLDGAEEEVPASSPHAPAQVPTGPRKPSPPTGPRNSGPTGPRATSAASVPKGPRSEQPRNGSAATGPRRSESHEKLIVPENQSQTKEAVQTPSLPTAPSETPTSDDGPLPEGWTVTQSRTHNRPFYHHKASGKTSWVRPTADPAVDQSSVPRLSPVPDEIKVPAAEPKQTPTAPASTDRPPPTGPARQSEPQPADPIDTVKSAYASREGKSNNVVAPVGPRNGRDPPRANFVAGEGNGRRARSPSPRRDDAKRFRRDDGRRSPPRPGPIDRRNDRGASPPRSRPNDPPRWSPPSQGRDRGPGPAGPPGNRPPRSPPRSDVRFANGANKAPLSANRWGSRSTSETAPTTAPVVAPAESDAAARKAKIAEQRRQAEEAVRRLAEEEAQIEKEEKERQEAEEKRKAEQVARDEERKRREEEARRRPSYRPTRPDDRPMPSGLDTRYNYRPAESPPMRSRGPDRAMPMRSPPRGNMRDLPPGLARRDSRGSPPRGASTYRPNYDGPREPPRMGREDPRDLGRMRDDPRDMRRPLPPPLRDSPPRRFEPRARDDGRKPSLIERMRPSPWAEPMAGPRRPRSPPPGLPDRLERRSGPPMDARPLAERMGPVPERRRDDRDRDNIRARSMR